LLDALASIEDEYAHSQRENEMGIELKPNLECEFECERQLQFDDEGWLYCSPEQFDEILRNRINELRNDNLPEEILSNVDPNYGPNAQILPVSESSLNAVIQNMKHFIDSSSNIEGVEVKKFDSYVVEANEKVCQVDSKAKYKSSNSRRDQTDLSCVDVGIVTDILKFHGYEFDWNISRLCFEREFFKRFQKQIEPLSQYFYEEDLSMCKDGMEKKIVYHQILHPVQQVLRLRYL
jgi:hypothetical protein